MKPMAWVAFFLLMTLCACRIFERNPFETTWETPFEAPPFDRIKPHHWMPAFKKAMARHEAEIRAIARNPEPATFENTIEAMAYAGLQLERVEAVFDNLQAAQTNETIQAIAQKVSPLLSRHRDAIYLDERLFARVKAVWDRKADLFLTPEQARLLEKTYKRFVRHGALLSSDKKARLRQINEELARLTLQFDENILKENNRFELLIEDPRDLAGLPDGLIQQAAEEATRRGYSGRWVFTLHAPSLIPFLTYAQNRTLREKLFKAYITRGDHGDELDNKKCLSRIVALRAERARLLGYPTHAHYVLEENMAKTPDAVYDFLRRLWDPALSRALAEAKALQQMIDAEGGGFSLEPWDWWFYAEKLRKARYDLDEEALRPYFPLESVRQGAFDVANRLWGISFEKRTDVPTYHPDVEVFEVKDHDGSHLGLLYTDYFPREGKRGGAWMNNLREQFRWKGRDMRPIVCNVGNFTRPPQDTPSLLRLEEVETLFHEFGHALHGLFSQCTYPVLSGTNVPRDFVELPSQIMEHWATEPEVLKTYARHYRTGEPIPDVWIQKIQEARLFNQGFATIEYLAAAFLDMDWHTLSDTSEVDPTDFEKASLERVGLPPTIVVRYRSPYFRHIFAGGYSAGYYSYIWAEMLDVDAFEAFQTAGLFDPETARRFREEILAKGDTNDPLILYIRFRGRPPTIGPLLRQRGLDAMSSG